MFLHSRWHVPNRWQGNQIVKDRYPPSPAVVIRWPPSLIASHQGFWILIQTLKELQICLPLNQEIGKNLQLEVHQQGDPNAPLHPLVLIFGASPRKSPLLSLPARGTPARGRGAGRGVGRSLPVGTVNPQPQRKPGQAGFVQRGGSGPRGASRSSPRLTLPSFSTEEDDDDDDEEDNEDGDKEEEEGVDFPNQGAGQHQCQTVQTGKQPC